MENASKALIIAGAILLSILIIALGIFIYNQARAAINTNTLDAQAAQTFNSPIEEYEGSKLGSNIRSLVSNLISNAGSYAGSADYLPSVNLTDTVTGNTWNNAEGGTAAAADGSTYVANLATIRQALVNSHYYTVSFEYNTAGLVSVINIAY